MKIEYLNPGEDMSNARKVRTEVFVTEQKFDEENEFDDIDATAYHVVVFNDKDNPVATGRLFADENKEGQYIIGRVAVAKEGRGTGLGRSVMLALEEKAKSIGSESLYLGAQDHAVEFYKKLGYDVCGEKYMDEHTPHFPMSKKL